MVSANITQLNAVVKVQGRHALLRQMGYHNFDKSLKRLDELLNSPSVYAWTRTKRAGFDFKYSAIEFIKELYKVAEKQAYFKAVIKSHYQESNGTIGICGTIKHYVVFAGDTKKIVYFHDGSVAPISEKIDTAKAVLELKGKDIVPIITGS